MRSLVHCFADDALGFLDAVGVADAIRAGLVDRAEVLEAAIARVRRIEPQLRAVEIESTLLAGAHVRRPRPEHVPAGRAAHARPGIDLSFSGVPTFVKDDTDVRGLPSAHGSGAFSPRPAKREGPAARQFLAQGFALLGKSRLPEFGLSPTTEYAARPPVRNPWDTEYSAGGSSGGGAALVASGAVPIAHGNDGGGSIRIPAAVNGLVGLKTTRCRLLDRPGARQAPINLISEGVLTRSVRDTAHYLAAAERFHPHPGLEAVGLVEGPGQRRLRIGVIERDVFERPVHPECAAALRSAADALAGQGHHLVEARLGVRPGSTADFKLYWALGAAFMCGVLAGSYGRGFRYGRLEPFTRGLVRFASRNAARIVPAVRRLRREGERYEAKFSEVDVLLSPVLAHPAPRLGELAPDQPFAELFDKLTDWVGFTPINNVSGGPAISLPHGVMAAGLPGSVQLAAPRGGERTLLELGHELEAASPFPHIAGVSSAAARAY
jgi:amidase